MGYPGVDRYQALADSLAINGNVTLPGRIMYKDLHAYLALGDVAVAPKMSETEGSGKIPNYMAMGLPIVTFDTPVSREYLGEIGIYARLGSAADLAEKLQLALEQREWAARLGQLGREWAVRELSSSRAGPEIEAIYTAAQARFEPRRGLEATAPTPQHDEHEEAVERGA
jgi:glycosyltransferase involved in cell wall biosynthesis